jgi:Glyoxalase-like domain
MVYHAGAHLPRLRLVRIDHVIYAARDLEATTARLEKEYGLAATGGGRHEAIGTHNRTIPLGGGYLEVLAVADAEEASASDLGRAVMARIDAGDGPMGWAVSVEDAATHAERLGLELSDISRQGLTAKLAGLAQSMAEPCLPFFIERDPGSPDPGAGGDAGGIRWLQVTGDVERVERWLGGANLPVRVDAGRPAVNAMCIGRFVLV